MVLVLDKPFHYFNFFLHLFSLCPDCAWTQMSSKYATWCVSNGMNDGEGETGMGEGGRNAHPVIPWFARRQALYSSSTRAQWALYRGANQPCQAIACLIKGQERGALSANDWRENKTYFVFQLVWLGGGLFCADFSSHAVGEHFSVWPDVWVQRYSGLSRQRSVSPRKVNIRYRDVFRHSGLKKHARADTIHTHFLPPPFTFSNIETYNDVKTIICCHYSRQNRCCVLPSLHHLSLYLVQL